MKKTALAEALKKVRNLRGETQRSAPWQLLLTGDTKKIAFSAETNEALAGVFDLLPELSHVTLKTADGDISVSRDFTANYIRTIDDLIASILWNEPAVTAIVFPAAGTRSQRTATVNDPHLLPGGGRRLTSAQHSRQKRSAVKLPTE